MYDDYYTKRANKKSWLYHYFDIQIEDRTKARFRRNRITRRLFIFQFNCASGGNSWHEPGYGYGKWTALN
jgi:hypothetical protein